MVGRGARLILKRQAAVFDLCNSGENVPQGCSQDNVACEGFFGRLKTELFYPRDWSATTFEQFIREVDAYIRWYNEEHIKLLLGSRSPVEYRQRLGLTV